LLSLRNNTDGAKEAFETAREKANKTLLAYAAEGRLAELVYASGDFETAQKYANELIRENGGGDRILLARARLILARCYHRAGNDQKAIWEYQQIRLEYEASREKATDQVASPNVYVAAVSELLDILKNTGMRGDATIVRDKYNAIPGLPPLPSK
ncbi:MAG: tetratricopeptide repeat protein, partial [Lentisphaeria bacterium]|nr:tetratricopeptide repeat protein [Lentisphaeria bacterium]